MEHAIVIPALNPDKKMLVLVDELTKMGAGRIIVVDDGSADASKKVFRQLRSRENVVLLRHLVNKGKGAALKTAFSYCFEHLRDTVSGVITADCDGQHTPRDIFRISEALAAAPDCLILGVRDFAGAAVPRRSLMGNRVTSRFFSLMYHVYLPDTQTGLRGIPASELEWMTKLTGQKYDYEINMLIQAKRRKIGFRQIGIEVV
ncbi:MAG: glycosyltransferase family 2 protein, partial [Firmicutes bacterium]|nr:glycosyltransferase family 2 protein [Bacillota bacterium]